jgi:probable HAF family extracellular repeat protein
MQDMGNLLGDASYAEAFSVSFDGAVVVGASDSPSGMREAFRWTTQGMTGLGFLAGGDWSEAKDTSAAGAVVVGHSNGTAGRQAFRWTAASGMVGLGFLPGGIPYSLATAVSADGNTVVGMARSPTLGDRAFRWTSAGSMTDLGDLGTYGGVLASDVSADGTRVVGWDRHEAFLWDQSYGMRPLRDVLIEDYGLDLNGWDLEYAHAISADGTTIVGSGTNPAGNTEAWAARIPEPTALHLLIAYGALALPLRRR